MKQRYVLLLSLFVLGACKTANNSELQDAALVNVNAKAVEVVFEHEGFVYLKECNPKGTSPFTRNCSDEGYALQWPMALTLEAYLDSFRYDVGQYSRDEKGLKAANSELSATQQAAANGARQEPQKIQNLTRIKTNLEKLIQIRKDLTKDITVARYDTEQEFDRMRAPFAAFYGNTFYCHIDCKVSCPNKQADTYRKEMDFNFRSLTDKIPEAYSPGLCASAPYFNHWLAGCTTKVLTAKARAYCQWDPKQR